MWLLAVVAWIRPEVTHVGADAAQPSERLTNSSIVNVTLAVHREVVVPELFYAGRDSIRVRLTPRTANSVRISSSAPE